MFKSLLYIAILTTIVVISWVGFSVYHNRTTSTISEDLGIRITPIPGSFNKETIAKIKAKKAVSANLSETRAPETDTENQSQNNQATQSASVNVATGSAGAQL